MQQRTSEKFPFVAETNWNQDFRNLTDHIRVLQHKNQCLKCKQKIIRLIMTMKNDDNDSHTREGGPQW